MTARPLQKRMLLGALLACLALLAVSCGLSATVSDFMDSQDTSLRKRVCLANFTSGIKGLEPQTAAWQKAMQQKLAAQGNLVLVGFDKLTQEMEKLPAKVRSQEERAISAGRTLGLTSVVMGQVTDLSVKRKLTGIYGFRDNDPFLGLEAEIRILDIANGTVAGQENFRPQIELNDVQAEAIRLGEKPKDKQVQEVLAELVKETSGWMMSTINSQAWAAYVLEVKGDMAKITVGRDTGLPVGSHVMVYGRGEKLRTGAGTVLYITGAPLAKLRITDLKPRVGWAKIVPISDKEKEAPKVEAGLLVRSN
jgi:exosome complex RNA-binding protein Csl4